MTPEQIARVERPIDHMAKDDMREAIRIYRAEVARLRVALEDIAYKSMFSSKERIIQHARVALAAGEGAVIPEQERYTQARLRDFRTLLAERDAARAEVVSLKCALSAKENELFAIADDDIDALRAQHQQELSAARAEVAALKGLLAAMSEAKTPVSAAVLAAADMEAAVARAEVARLREEKALADDYGAGLFLALVKIATSREGADCSECWAVETARAALAAGETDRG
jgi:hypothetical protein